MLKPSQAVRDTLAVDEQACKEQVEQHRQTSNEIRNARILDGNRDEQYS